MPNNSISIISSSQATLEEAIKHDIVNDLDDVMDAVNDWPGIHVKANECDGITRRSCNDEVCAGCPVFYVYNVDAAAAKITSCRAHRKLYAQDILVDLMPVDLMPVDLMPVDLMPVDLMELQVKFAGFAVIITDEEAPGEPQYSGSTATVTIPTPTR